MARVAVVHVDFSREGRDYKRGEIIADPAMLAYLDGHDHGAHVTYTELPDEHHAVAPFMAMPEAEPEPRRRRRRSAAE